MTNITEEIRNIVIAKSNEFERLTKGTKDEYNLYNNHIKYVYDYILKLSKDEKVDLEVIKLSALLHDISMTEKSLDRSNHNIYSSEIAEKLLTKYNYDKDKISLIKKCILNHSSNRIKYRDTLEEELLVTADSLSHFDNIYSLYSLSRNIMNLNDEESLKFIKNKLTKDYNEIIPKYKYLVEDKYKTIMNLTTLDELLNYLKEGDNMLIARELTISDKEQVIEMSNEIKNYDNNYEGLSNTIKDIKDYNLLLEKLEKNKHQELIKPNLSPQTTYGVFKDNKLIGMFHLRHVIKGELINHGGNIGYLIRPSERKKGYGTKMLELALDKAKELNLDKVLISCREENIASKKVIEKNGGIYENNYYDKEKDNTYRRYWIHLKDKKRSDKNERNRSKTSIKRV